MRTANLLLVEDNEGDIILAKEALQHCPSIRYVNVVRDGKEAIDYLYQQGNHTDAELPDLILLDINLPIKNGLEILQTIKNDKQRKHIPVIMLTTSSSDRDINTAYLNHANCYIIKPDDIHAFMQAIHTVENFWIHIAQLPRIGNMG